MFPVLTLHDEDTAIILTAVTECKINLQYRPGPHHHPSSFIYSDIPASPHQVDKHYCFSQYRDLDKLQSLHNSASRTVGVGHKLFIWVIAFYIS